MAPLKGEGGERRHSNASGEQPGAGVSIKAQEVVKHQPTMGEVESDGEEEYTGCCLFRSRSLSRRLKGAAYSRLESDEPDGAVKASSKAKVNLQRSRSICAEFFCCCGPRVQTSYTTVEVRSVDGAAKQDRKWEVDVNEEQYKPPYWKQLARKLTSHGHVRRHSRGSDWLSYDPYTYQMNFDDGCRRENCVSYLFTDEKGDADTRARAMHAALLKKFAADRALKQGIGSPGSPMSPILSPLPVKMLSKEEIEKSKQGFVPIWQRRQGAPPIKLDLRQRSGPMD